MESNKRNLQKWNAVDFVGLTCVHPSRSVSPRMRCRMPSAAAFLELEPLPCLGGPLAALICKFPLFSFSLPWPTADDLATEEQRRCASDVSSRVDEQPVCPINLPDRGIMLIISIGHDQGDQHRTGASTTLQHSQHPNTNTTPNQQYWMACAMHVVSPRDCSDLQCNWLPLDALGSTWEINLSPIPFKRLIPLSIQILLWSRLWTNPQGNLKEKFRVNNNSH